MRPQVWSQSSSCVNAAPPASATGSAQSSNGARLTTVTSATRGYQPRAAAELLHQGASSATGNTCSSITGPFASRPAPSATPNTVQDAVVARPPPPDVASTTALTASSTQQASRRSNITAPVNAIQPSVLPVMTATNPARAPSDAASSSAMTRRASRTVRPSAPSANRPVSRRGQTVSGPVNCQPARIDQKSSGGLWP